MNQNSYVGARPYQGNPTLEKLTTLLSARQPCFFDLAHLGAIRVEGEKAPAFLQGQVTCDLQAVTPQSMRQGALCNIKGRILALMDIIQYQEHYWLILPKDLINLTIQSLEKVAMLSRVRLTCVPEVQLMGVWIPASASTEHRDLSLPTTPYGVHSTPDWCSYATHPEHFMLFSTEKRECMAEGIIMDEIYWHYLQLDRGYISIYPETRALFLPHALKLPALGFIDFQKGCYKGQEIIARMHYRGAPLKHSIQFTRLTLPDTTPILGKALCAPDNPDTVLGEIIDYCPLEQRHDYLLAYC